MGQDQGGGVVLEGPSDHLPRVHAGAIDGAAEQLFELDDPMTVVQKQTGEDLVGIMA